jgi:hypothetical protein
MALSPDDIDFAQRVLKWIEDMGASDRVREEDRVILDELAITLGQYHGMKMRIQELTKLLEEAGITY